MKIDLIWFKIEVQRTWSSWSEHD